MDSQVRFSGFGGQGVILMGIVLARAAVLYDRPVGEDGKVKRKSAIQTQSYGPSARGGHSKCDVKVSDEEMLYPFVEIPDYLHSLVLGFHVAAALLGYTGISLSAVYGFLFLMLYHDIKSSRFGLVYNRLPNLEGLEGMSYRAELFGFVTLGIAIAIGLLWLPTVFKDFSYLDPKLVATVVIWAIYAVGLWAKRRFGWKGRKTMLLSLVAFCIVFFSMTIVNIYLSEFHKFH